MELNTGQITGRLAKVNGFQGVFPRDAIPEVIRMRPAAMVVNTDVTSKPGQHWLAIYLPEEGACEYLDPLGLPPMYPEVISFLFTNCTLGYMYSDSLLQSPLSAYCGHYCILFLLLRNSGITYNDFLSLFTRNTVKNDSLVGKLVK